MSDDMLAFFFMLSWTQLWCVSPWILNDDLRIHELYSTTRHETTAIPSRFVIQSTG